MISQMRRILPGTRVSVQSLREGKSMHDVTIIQVTDREVVVDDELFRMFVPLSSVASVDVLKKELSEDED